MVTDWTGLHSVLLRGNLGITICSVTKSSLQWTVFFTPVVVKCMKKNLDIWNLIIVNKFWQSLGLSSYQGSTIYDYFLILFSFFCSIEKVSKIVSPVLVIHGTEDEVIDFSHGLAIYERCPRTVDPLWVEGAGHNDVELYGQYLERLKQFIQHELVTNWLIG